MSDIDFAAAYDKATAEPFSIVEFEVDVAGLGTIAILPSVLHDASGEMMLCRSIPWRTQYEGREVQFVAGLLHADSDEERAFEGLVSGEIIAFGMRCPMPEAMKKAIVQAAEDWLVNTVYEDPEVGIAIARNIENHSRSRIFDILKEVGLDHEPAVKLAMGDDQSAIWGLMYAYLKSESDIPFPERHDQFSRNCFDLEEAFFNIHDSRNQIDLLSSSAPRL